MKNSVTYVLILMCVMMNLTSSSAQSNSKPKYVLAIHGGAGTILKKKYDGLLGESIYR